MLQIELVLTLRVCFNPMFEVNVFLLGSGGGRASFKTWCPFCPLTEVLQLPSGHCIPSREEVRNDEQGHNLLHMRKIIYFVKQSWEKEYRQRGKPWLREITNMQQNGKRPWANSEIQEKTSSAAWCLSLSPSLVNQPAAPFCSLAETQVLLQNGVPGPSERIALITMSLLGSGKPLAQAAMLSPSRASCSQVAIKRKPKYTFPGLKCTAPVLGDP